MKKTIINLLLLLANLNESVLECTEKIIIDDINRHYVYDHENLRPDDDIYSVTITCSDISSIFNYNYVFENLNASQTLICENSTIDYFPIFPTFSGITELKLKNFNVSNTKPRAFKNLKNLNILDLSYSGITKLPILLMNSGADKLKIIYLNGNKIRQIYKVLDGDEIYLDHNKIETINVPFGHVKILSLRDNNLKVMKNSFFQNPKELKELYLGFNNISKIDEDLFENMSNLETLDFINNNITDINLFQNLPKLKYLMLSNNKIEKLSMEIFDNLPNLETLYIDGNKLKDLDQELLKPLPNVFSFTLKRNQVSSWQVSRLKEHCPNLNIIKMNNNKWNCQSLTDIIGNLKKQNIVIVDAYTHDGDNVEGIACTKQQ